jgi:hypothetical protein
MSARLSARTCCFLFGLAACGSVTDSDRAARSAGATELRALADELVTAVPLEWPQLVDRLTKRADGDSLAPVLIEAALRNPDRLGAECALALAATQPNTTAPELLLQVLDQPRATAAVAARAALCLRPGATASTLAELSKRVQDRRRPTLVRTAAATVLIDHGDRELAVDFLCAVLLAGTNGGGAVREAFGIADDSRWALERTLALEALERNSGGVRFDLRADSDWPTLIAGAARIRTHFGRSDG